MSLESPLRPWMALCAVIAVGGTAIAIRPSPPPRGGTATHTRSRAGLLSARAFPVAVLSPAIHAAPRPLDTPITGTVRPRSPGVPVPEHMVAASPVDATPAAPPAAAAGASPAVEPALPAHTLVAWGAVHGVEPAGAAAGPARGADRGWAPRTGGAVGGGMRAASRGVRTGFFAVGRSLRRAF